ncbi:unnamed protein product [Musa acuminata subsp. burmannicoides]
MNTSHHVHGLWMWLKPSSIEELAAAYTSKSSDFESRHCPCDLKPCSPFESNFSTCIRADPSCGDLELPHVIRRLVSISKLSLTLILGTQLSSLEIGGIGYLLPQFSSTSCIAPRLLNIYSHLNEHKGSDLNVPKRTLLLLLLLLRYTCYYTGLT